MTKATKIEKTELTAEQLVQKLQCYFLDSKISRSIASKKTTLLIVARLLLAHESEELRLDLVGDKFILHKD